MSIDMFKLLADNMVQPVWIMNTNLEIIYANEEYIKIHSNTIGKIIGVDTKDICSDELKEGYIEDCQNTIKTLNVSTRIEYFNDAFIERTVIPLLNDNGELIALCGTYKEVISLDNENNKIIKLLIDSFPGHIFYKNEKGKYVYANKKFHDYCKEKGMPNPIGKNDEELNVIKEKPNNNEFNLENETGSFKRKIQNVDEDTYFEVIEETLIENNKTLGTIGFALDISQKVKKEKTLQELSYRDVLTNTYNRAYFEKKCDEYGKCPENIAVIMGDVNGLKIVNDSLGHIEGDKLLKTISKVLLESTKGKGLVFRIGGDEFIILIENSNEDECREVVSSITSKCRKFDHKLVNISISLGYSVTDGPKKVLLSAIKEAENYVYKAKLRKEKSIKESIVNSTVEKLNSKSIEKYEHIERVMENAVYIGGQLKLNAALMEELVLTSKLHDIGKIGVDEDILLKSNTLTKDELDSAHNHAEKGYRILKAADALSNVSKSVLTHHERWDGKGYPLGLKGTDIPIVARIVSVVDSYDVMINGTAYKEPMTEEEAIEELRNCAGTQFDPEIVEIFIKHISVDN